LCEAQAELFASGPVVRRADPEKAPGKLGRILAEARAAKAMPWDRARRRLYAKSFPQMTLWLPDEEAAQYRLQFEKEMARLVN
jgi:hypothetical protein